MQLLKLGASNARMPWYLTLSTEQSVAFGALRLHNFHLFIDQKCRAILEGTHARAAGNGAIDLGEVLLELRSYEFRNAIGAVGVFARFDSENVAHWLRVAADFADEG
nr:hypothetical protein Itr_chr06CG05740 [Ipomoea trifida]